MSQKSLVRCYPTLLQDHSILFPLLNPPTLLPPSITPLFPISPEKIEAIGRETPQRPTATSAECWRVCPWTLPSLLLLGRSRPSPRQAQPCTCSDCLPAAGSPLKGVAPALLPSLSCVLASYSLRDHFHQHTNMLLFSHLKHKEISKTSLDLTFLCSSFPFLSSLQENSLKEDILMSLLSSLSLLSISPKPSLRICSSPPPQPVELVLLLYLNYLQKTFLLTEIGRASCRERV